MQKIQLSAILLLTFTFVGCGPQGLNTCYVEGVITLDGQPLDGALVTFFPADTTEGKVAAGTSDASGKYTLTSDGGLPEKGALEGDYVVTVKKVEIVPDGPPPAPGPGADRPGYVPPAQNTIQKTITPKNYSLLDKTPLKATVQKGKNTIPLELTSK